MSEHTIMRTPFEITLISEDNPSGTKIDDFTGEPTDIFKLMGVRVLNNSGSRYYLSILRTGVVVFTREIPVNLNLTETIRKNIRVDMDEYSVSVVKA